MGSCHEHDVLSKTDDSSVALSAAMSGAGISRDSSYYCHDVIVLVRDSEILEIEATKKWLQVDKTLFKVPRAVFNNSEVFQDKFAMPLTDGEPIEETCDEHPLRLEGHSATEFRRLLKVLLPL
jgi:hypothetical protein